MIDRMSRVMVWFLSSFFFCLSASPCAAVESRWHKDVLSVRASAPPALMFVQDSQGRRTGANPDVPMDEFGRGGELNEIPNSLVDQINIADDATGEPRPFTSWESNVYDGGAQKYTVHLDGVGAGICELAVGLFAPMADPTPNPEVVLLRVVVIPGVRRQFVVVADRRTGQLEVTRSVTADTLGSTIEGACQLGMIAPQGVCQSLKVKIEAISDAVSRGNPQAARGQVQAFLNELKAQQGKHVKEPAATILREEAEALLKSLGGESGEAQETARPKRWWWPLDWFGS